LEETQLSLSGGQYAVVAVFAFLLGTVIGSFLNVVVYRLPRGGSLVRPGSSCPSCGHAIRWYHNVPIVGWAVIRGRCRDCGEKVSVRYPLVEAITGALFLCGFFAFGLSPQLPLALGFMAVLVPITFIDLDHHIIPDRIVLPAAGVGLAYSMLLDPSRWWQYIISGLGAALFLFVIALLWAGGMGMGDVKLALLLGFVLGPQVVVGLFAAFLFGGVVGMALLASRRKTRKDRVAFGPFLSGGAVLSLFVGPLVTEWYLGLF